MNTFLSGSNNVRMFMKNQDFITSMGSSIQIISQAQMKYSGNNLTLINATITGRDERILQGILRVKVNGLWGVACDNQFDIVAARIACTELGLVAYPDVRSNLKFCIVLIYCFDLSLFLNYRLLPFIGLENSSI